MENEPITTTDNTHPSVKPYKKWIEWTLILLLVAIVIGLIQIYLTTQTVEPTEVIVEQTVQPASPDEISPADSQILLENLANQPLDNEIMQDGLEVPVVQPSIDELQTLSSSLQAQPQETEVIE